MHLQIHHHNGLSVAELREPQLVVNSLEDALDLLGNIYYQGFDRLVLHEHQLTEAFFDLKTKLAGDILQKFSNYRVRLAIVGQFEKYNSERLKEFIRESNSGNLIYFSETLEESLNKLSQSA